MAARYLTLLINDEAMALEKHRIVMIEPKGDGTRIVLKGTYQDSLLEYFTKTNYRYVLESYNS